VVRATRLHCGVVQLGESLSKSKPGKRRNKTAPGTEAGTVSDEDHGQASQLRLPFSYFSRPVTEHKLSGCPSSIGSEIDVVN
jgi:hypothetical protein